ncbi:zinc-finger homeodomain protein 11-like [Wolffia australiana]
MDGERSAKEQYRECMHNHAASLGSYATDGCGEFLADAASPGGLLCAACGCHRNFHRKYVAVELAEIAPLTSPTVSEERGGEKRRTRTKFTAEQKQRMQQFAEKIGWRVQKKGGNVGGGDDIAVFCREIGVSRQVFKVWMHNHKNSTAVEASPPAEAEMDNAKGSISSLTQ